MHETLSVLDNIKMSELKFQEVDFHKLSQLTLSAAVEDGESSALWRFGYLLLSAEL